MMVIHVLTMRWQGWHFVSEVLLQEVTTLIKRKPLEECKLKDILQNITALFLQTLKVKKIKQQNFVSNKILMTLTAVMCLVQEHIRK